MNQMSTRTRTIIHVTRRLVREAVRNPACIQTTEDGMVREHRLNRIEFGSKDTLLRQIPDFDLYSYSRITTIRVEWDSGSENRDLVVFLTGEYSSASTNVYEVTFRLGGVRQLRLPEINEQGLWLSELELEEMTGNQMEGVCFKLHDYGSGEFTVLCERVEVVSVKEM